MSSPDAGRPDRRAVLEQLSRAQKPPGAGSPAYSRFVNRRLGRQLAAVAHLAGATPDQVSILSAAATAGALVLVAFAPVGVFSAVAVTAALVLGYALDSADGQLARLTGRSRPAGEWLDHTIDAFKVPAVHLSVLIGWYHGVDRRGALLLAPVLFAVLASGLFFTPWVMERMRREHAAAARVAAAGRRGTVRSLLLLPTDFGVLILLFLLWGAPAVFAAGYLALLIATVLFAALALPRWFGEVVTFGVAR
ncbi:MAG: CDP-alcohol phosphatidyltransferase family protein [Kineosporiaceae bacterium]